MFAETPHLQKALERFTHNTALNARRSLEAKRKKVSIKAKWIKEGGEWKPTSQTRRTYLGNSVASWRLAQSLTGRVTDAAIIFEMEYYGQWIDQGRKPSKKFPPPLAMRQYITDKKLKLRDTGGKFARSSESAKKAVAFLIGRKIKAFGIPATGFFSSIFLRAFDKLPDEITDALVLDFDILIEKKGEN